MLAFAGGTVLLGALLAPPLYWAGKHAVAAGWIEGGLLGGLHDSLDRARFSRYFNRAILLGAFLMLWPVLRWKGGSRPRGGEGASRAERMRAALLLRPNPRWAAHFGAGFAAAAGSLLALGGLYVALGWYEFRPGAAALPGILLAALGTGLAVGFLEEFVFRGALHAVLAKVLSTAWLLPGIAAFFALVHFFHVPGRMQPDEITFLSGFAMLGTIFAHFAAQFAELDFLLAEFAVLFAIGLVLGWTRIRTASLWLAIGLHAGWVFGVKTFAPLTARAFEPAEKMPWLGNNLRVGLLSVLVVCLTWLGLWLWLRREAPGSGADGEGGADGADGEGGEGGEGGGGAG